MLTLPSSPVLSYYSDLVLPLQPRQSLAWSISVIQFTVLSVSCFLGTCCVGTGRLTCQDDDICLNGQGVLVPHASIVSERVYEIWLSWFFVRPSFDPVFSIVAVVRCAEIDWTGLRSLDTLFPYCGETGKD